MTYLDQLERLNKLRECGVLSDEEFRAEKAKLLAKENEIRRFGSPAAWAPIIGAIVLAAAIAALLVYGPVFESSKQQGDSRSAEPNAIVSTPEPSLSDDVVGASSAQPSEGSYAWATSSAVIGINPAYLEARLGPAREKSPHHMDFQLGRCAIYYTVAGSEITSLTAHVDEACHPNGITPQTTFGELLRNGHGRYRADCIEGCGNAADPTIEVFFEGARAQQYISESYWSASLDNGGGGSLDPMRMWAMAIRRAHGLAESEVPPDFNIFSCVANPSPDVAAALANVRVEGVTLGRNLHPNCSS